MKYVQTDNNTAIIKVKGILGINIARTLESEFFKAQEIGCNKVVYDCTNTEAIDSVGLATLMNMNKRIKERPKLKNANTEILKLLQISDMLDEFELI